MAIAFCKNMPRTIDTESKDCAVRAVSIACDIPYHEAHERFSKAGRKPNKGVDIDLLEKVMERKPMQYCITLSRFVALNPTGRFVVIKRGHAFAVVNGAVHDSGRLGGNTKVYAWWRFQSA